LLTCGRRAVIVPRVKPGVEQLLRAQRLSEMGLVSMVHPEDLTPETLAEALFQQIDALYGAMASPRLPARRGLERTSASLLELLGLTKDKAVPRRSRAPAPAQDHLRAPRSVHQPLAVQA
jgi:predicted glycosyltransferase